MPPRLGAFLAIVFWGVAFVFTKRVVSEIPPAALVFARACLGTLLLLGLLAWRGERLLPPRRALPQLLVMGFIGVAFHQMLQAEALRFTSAINTGWLIGLIPVWSALLAAALGRERFGPLKVVGLAVGFGGALLVVTRGHLGGGFLALPSTRGDLLVLASTVNWAVYSLIGLRTIRELGPTQATAGAMMLGAAMLLPFFLAAGGPALFRGLTPVGLAALLALGFLSSGLGYLFWYGALEKIEATKVAAFLYLEPLATLGAAVVLLGEPVGVATVAGGALVLLGVAIVQRAK
ncbi:MAG: DMT family transporter [Deltaproteobacteria bacterium]|nr:DMT family transporter [Deltaproteobacteria bacterium]